MRRTALSAGLFLLIGLGIYAHSFGNGFVLDDENQIVNNSLVQSLSHISIFFSGSTMHQANGHALGGVYYKPLMTLAYATLWSIDPGNAFPFHLFQFFLVVINAALLLLLLERFMSYRWAWLAALIYLVHPINSEVALYIADLQDALYTFFGLCALNLQVRWIELNWQRAGLLAALLLFSLLAKESGVLFVLTSLSLTLLERRPVNAGPGTLAAAKANASLRKSISAYLLSIAIYLWLRLGVAHLDQVSAGFNKIGATHLGTRLLTSPLVLFSYFRNFFFPINFSTTQDWLVEDADLWRFWIPLVTLTTGLGLALWLVRREWKAPNPITGARGQRAVTFFFLWLMFGLGLHSQIAVPLDGTFADRWFYFPCAGWLAILALLADRIVSFRTKQWLFSAGLLFACIGSARSFVRAEDWHDNFVLCDHDLKVFPDSYDLHNNLGVELFRRGRIEEAKTEFERSIELQPAWDVNWSNLGATYIRLNEFSKAEVSYLRSMSHGPYYLAYENYASLLVSENRFDEARHFLEEKALPQFPASPLLQSLYARLQKTAK